MSRDLLFERSRRSQKAFVKVNCAAIPHDLLESELFGYEAGAFTGATRDKPGKFELANHGTLFLDEIAEMHPMLQAKLLHVLQDGKFSRLGAKRDVSVNVRVICGPINCWKNGSEKGCFAKICSTASMLSPSSLPPPRERLDEIPVLTDYMLRKYAIQYDRALHRFSPEVTRRMREYDWPGNIRELENLCKRFVIVGSETQILRELRGPGRPCAAVIPETRGAVGTSRCGHDSSPAHTGSAHDLSLLEVGRRAAWEAERRAIQEMLETTHWNRREASRRLQVSYKALLNKIKQMNLEETAASAEALEKDKQKTSTQ